MTTSPGVTGAGPANCSEMEAMSRRYLQWMEVLNYSKATIEGYTLMLKYFRRWCEEQGIFSPQEVTGVILEQYQNYLHTYLTDKGRPMTQSSQNGRMVVLRMFFSWLSRANYLLYNPASELELSRKEERLPGAVLSHEEFEEIVRQVNLEEPLGFRDRAMLETFYSTGIRRRELLNLEMGHIDGGKGTLMVRQGKNKKDRLIPIGERALYWIGAYLTHLRAALAFAPGIETLFLNIKGYPLAPGTVTVLMAKYIKKSGINKPGSCHIFRHSMATAMVENGADIRFVQEMLGHKSLSTTQVYTRLSIEKLKEVHRRCHPGTLNPEP